MAEALKIIEIVLLSFVAIMGIGGGGYLFGYTDGCRAGRRKERKRGAWLRKRASEREIIAKAR